MRETYDQIERLWSGNPATVAVIVTPWSWLLIRLLIVTCGLVRLLIVAGLLTIAGVPRIAQGSTAEAACCRTDRGTFQATPALVPDDAADAGTHKSTEHRARLSVWTCRTGH